MSNKYAYERAIKQNSMLESHQRWTPRVDEYGHGARVSPTKPKVTHDSLSVADMTRGSAAVLCDQLSRYGLPVVTILHLLSLYTATLQPQSADATKFARRTTNHLEQYQPDCLYLHEEDGNTDHSEAPVLHEIQPETDTVVQEPQLQAGEPISFTKKYQTAPLSTLFIENRRFNAATIAFVDCTQELESHAVNTAVEVSAPLQASSAETITATVAHTDTNPFISSSTETDMPVLGLPAEPRVHIFWDEATQSTILLFTNNIGLQLYKVEKIDKKIQLHKLTDYVPLSTLVPEGCTIHGDVIPHIGPHGEIVIVSMDLRNPETNCVLYAHSFTDAKDTGFSVFSVLWPGMKVADFPAPLLRWINGKLYLVMSVNGFVTDRPNGINGNQPMMMLEVQEGLLTGSLFVNHSNGSPISLMAASGTNGEAGVMGVSGYTNNSGNYFQSSQLNAATQEMTYRPSIGEVTLPSTPAGCKFNTQSQLVCIEQYGSTTDVLQSSMHLDKEIHVISMADGTNQFIYQNLLAVGTDPNTVNTNLFVARMTLNADNTVTQGMSKVYHLLDEAGNHINVTDCQTYLQPNGEMLITCVGLNAYDANVVIALEINSDGTVKTAQVVRTLKEAYKGTTVARSGDYNGADSADATQTDLNLTVVTHFVGFRAVAVFFTPDGEEIEVVEPQPIPTATPETPTPEVLTPTPTATMTPPSSYTVFLPLTHK